MDLMTVFDAGWMMVRQARRPLQFVGLLAILSASFWI
jgi:hypothetical protein